MLVAVAGASGRVGRCLLKYLKGRKIKVVALVRSQASARRLPRGTKYRLVHFDTGYGLEEALKNVTHIVNLTGSTDSGLSEKELYNANVVPTSHLLSAASKDLARFVHVSSIAVYPKHPRGPVDENHHRAPADAYGKTKLEGERIALMHSRRLPVIVLQPGIIYGPGFEDGFYPVLKKLHEEKMALVGDGNNRFPLVHVNDVAGAIWCALSADVPSGSAYLIVSPEAITQKEAMALAADAMGVGAPRSHVSESVAKMAAHFSLLKAKAMGKKPSLTPQMVGQICADRLFVPDKARAQLGWKARVRHAAGIRSVVRAFMKENKPKIRKGNGRN